MCAAPRPAAASGGGRGAPSSALWDPSSLDSVVRCFSGRVLFLTGTTGYVGKLVLEKLLRCVPDVGEVIILVRPKKGVRPSVRAQKEIFSSPIFDRLRGEIGHDQFEQRVLSKVTPVEGELTQADLGLSAADLGRIHASVQLVLHSAATLDFDERIDRALEMNVRGPLKVLAMAKRCQRIEAMVHISTAYVNSNRQGFVKEELYPLGLDPEQLIDKVCRMSEVELDNLDVSNFLGAWPNTYTLSKSIAEHMLHQQHGSLPLAIVRPSIIGSCWREPVPGWIDTVSALGATLVNVGTGVLRVLPLQRGAVADVVPGDTVVNVLLLAMTALRNQTGRFTVFHATSSMEKPFHWNHCYDLAVEFFQKRPPPPSVRVSTPSFCPAQSPHLVELLFAWKYSLPSSPLQLLAPLWSDHAKQQVHAERKVAARARMLMRKFIRFLTTQWTFDNSRSRALTHMLSNEENIIFGTALADIDWTDYIVAFCYGLGRWTFRMDLIEYPMDRPEVGLPRRVHLEVGKKGWGEVQPLQKQVKTAGAGNDKWVDQKRKSSPGAGAGGGPFEWSRFSPVVHEWSQDLFSDLYMHQRVLHHRSLHSSSFGRIKRPREEMIHLLLRDEGLAARMAQLPAAKPKRARAPAGTLPAVSASQALHAQARAMAQGMVSELHPPLVNAMAYGLRKIWQQLFESIQVEKSGLGALRNFVATNPTTPLVFVSSHHSSLDAVLLSYICFICGLPTPYVAVPERAVTSPSVRQILGRAGSIFVREGSIHSGANTEQRTGTAPTNQQNAPSDTQLYNAMLDVYLRLLLADGQSLHIPLDGSRSRTGKMHPPDPSVLSCLLHLCSDSRVPDVHLVPVSINYERTAEAQVFAEQLLGGGGDATATSNSGGEDFWRAMLGKAKERRNCGTVSLGFQAPLSLRKAAQEEESRHHAQEQTVPTGSQSAPSGVDDAQVASCPCPSSSQQSAAAPPSFPPPADTSLSLRLAYRLANSLQLHSEVAPIHLVSTVLLLYRQGVTKQQLVSKVDWLRQEVLRQGGHTLNFAGHDRTGVVMAALRLLDTLVHEQRPGVYEPAIHTHHEPHHLLTLGMYRNKIGHLFFRESVLACALYAIINRRGGAAGSTALSASISMAARADATSGVGSPGPGPVPASSGSNATVAGGPWPGVAVAELLAHTTFLFRLLHREFLFSPSPPAVLDQRAAELCAETFASLVDRGILRVSSSSSSPSSSSPSSSSPGAASVVDVSARGDAHISFLCGLLWPFIDSYFVMALALHQLQQDKMQRDLLLQKAQWLATSLYRAHMLSYFESCSLSTLRTALSLFRERGLITVSTVTDSARPPRSVVPSVALSPPSTPNQPTDLHALLLQIDRSRKAAPVQCDLVRRGLSLSAEMPILAKL